MAYTNPNGKEFSNKGAAIRYYFAQGKTPEKISELSGIALRNVNVCLKADAGKNITTDQIDSKSGLLKSAIEKAKAKKETAKVETKKVETKAADSKNSQAKEAAKKTPEKKK